MRALSTYLRQARLCCDVKKKKRYWKGWSGWWDWFAQLPLGDSVHTLTLSRYSRRRRSGRWKEPLPLCRAERESRPSVPAPSRAPQPVGLHTPCEWRHSQPTPPAAGLPAFRETALPTKLVPFQLHYFSGTLSPTQCSLEIHSEAVELFLWMNGRAGSHWLSFHPTHSSPPETVSLQDTFKAPWASLEHSLAASTLPCLLVHSSVTTENTGATQPREQCFLASAEAICLNRHACLHQLSPLPAVILVALPAGHRTGTCSLSLVHQVHDEADYWSELCVCSGAQSCPTLVTLWTAARQAPLSMGLSRQAHWSGRPCPSPGDLPNPGIELTSPALQADSLPTEPPGKPCWEAFHSKWVREKINHSMVSLAA